MPDRSSFPRRRFLKYSAGTAAAVGLSGAPALPAAREDSVELAADSLVHPVDWETLNPGYWQVRDGSLRRRIRNYGDRARSTGFPFHYETHGQNGGVMDTDYDPSLPVGVIYRRDWKLRSHWEVVARMVYHGRADVRRSGDADDWRMYQPGYAQMGVAFGAQSLFESFHRVRNASLVVWTDDGQFGFTARPGRKGRKATMVAAPMPAEGDSFEIRVSAEVQQNGKTEVRAVLAIKGQPEVEVAVVVASREAEGYVGIAGRGLTDFSVSEFMVAPGENRRLDVRPVDCGTCYALGDTLQNTKAGWQVQFVALFNSDGEEAEIRVADSEEPAAGWARVPVAGKASIVSHQWRRNTASISVTLPFSPAERTLYYTVWKDGVNVTDDPRVGTDACGPGTGYVGDLADGGTYVGRLPQLTAPYRLCGLSCHAVNSGLQERKDDGYAIRGGGDVWQIRDQPTVGAYRHIDDYNFQIMCWEDDVWYLELVMYPPSTDDAWKIIHLTLCGPTTRRKMMRHWNVINPGDHDYGMDDVKGPEQLLLRNRDDLGQDRDYMRRNFRIVQHLISGSEEVDASVNPQRRHSWKMPNRDFTLVILDSRLWRSSQDTAIWDDEGWGHRRNLYDRTDPTRSLLGEEQFAWLQQLIRTDSSRLICCTGLNGLHTVWTGGKTYSRTTEQFAQRDRVAADYAGWVAAGADRVIELLGSRSGVVSVYGDVHNGCIMKNSKHRLIECSFGPIGRSGGRAVIDGFGPLMKDFDGRELEVTALYHQQHADPELRKHAPGSPFYWNFLEMVFDPSSEDPEIQLRVRNLMDEPQEEPRGGGALLTSANVTGRAPLSQLPAFRSLPLADVQLISVAGQPIRGTRSDARGYVAPTSLTEVEPETPILVTAFDGAKIQSAVMHTKPI